jgi:organic radical activating enzyme
LKIQANLIEIFTSFQGEGPRVGEEMTFVRFQNCALSCRFCDTPASFVYLPRFRLETGPHSGVFTERDNPVASAELTELIASFYPKILSLTGGEPLQHEAFLKVWLEELAGRYRILLETNGVLPKALRALIDRVDIISMDIKLPSVTGMRGFWEEHEEFLRIARQKEVYVKVVVAEKTDLAELRRALELVKRVDPTIPFILQPVTPAGQVHREVEERELRTLYEMSRDRLPEVRVIPQVHPRLGIL